MRVSQMFKTVAFLIVYSLCVEPKDEPDPGQSFRVQNLQILLNDQAIVSQCQWQWHTLFSSGSRSLKVQRYDHQGIGFTEIRMIDDRCILPVKITGDSEFLQLRQPFTSLPYTSTPKPKPLALYKRGLINFTTNKIRHRRSCPKFQSAAWTLTSWSFSSLWSEERASLTSFISSWACTRCAELWWRVTFRMWDLISHAHVAMPDTPFSWTRAKNLRKKYPEIATKVKKTEAKNTPRRIEARMTAE